jgi:hypothetical protein
MPPNKSPLLDQNSKESFFKESFFLTCIAPFHILSLPQACSHHSKEVLYEKHKLQD